MSLVLTASGHLTLYQVSDWLVQEGPLERNLPTPHPSLDTLSVPRMPVPGKSHMAEGKQTPKNELIMRDLMLESPR